MSGARAESATGVIAIFTVNSYTVIPMRIRIRRLVGGGMTTTFVSMTHDLTLGHRTEEVKTVFTSFPAYVTINHKGINHLPGIDGFRKIPKSIQIYSLWTSFASAICQYVLSSATIGS